MVRAYFWLCILWSAESLLVIARGTVCGTWVSHVQFTIKMTPNIYGLSFPIVNSPSIGLI